MQPPIYLINLAKSSERLEKSTKRLQEKNVDFTRVEGILGSALSEKELNQHYCSSLNSRVYHSPLSSGQIGCYLSHRKVWQLIADGDAKFGVVLEDDFILPGDLNEALNTIQQFDFEWDLIKLAAYQGRQRKIAHTEKANDSFNIVIHSKPMSGGAATAITKQAAKRLLAATNKFGRPCDTDIQHFWETNVNVLSLMPYPVEQDMSFESTISAKKETREKHFWRRKWQQLKAAYLNKQQVTIQVNDFTANHK